MRHIQGDQRDTRMREKMNNLKQDFKNSMTAVYLQNFENFSNSKNDQTIKESLKIFKNKKNF